MPSEPLTLKAEAQQVLDELWQERLLPFALRLGKITQTPNDEFTIHFYDSRIRTTKVQLTEGHSFKDVFRAAVLVRVDEMNEGLEEGTTTNPGLD